MSTKLAALAFFINTTLVVFAMRYRMSIFVIVIWSNRLFDEYFRVLTAVFYVGVYSLGVPPFF